MNQAIAQHCRELDRCNQRGGRMLSILDLLDAGSLDLDLAAYLMAKGYRILAKRYRTPHGEIDIVARRRNLIAFVEVKARATLDDAAFAVTPRQQRRIIDAAQGWLAAHPEHAEFELRFDAMLIAPRSLPRHVLAAFDAST